MIKVEICTGSYVDALAAEKGGAQRIELCSGLFVGGLTSSIGTLQLIKKNTKLEVAAIVRCRDAGFCYSQEEFEVMYHDAKILLENGADAIVFGFLNNDFTINVEYTKKMVDLIHSYKKEAVFHRAFDVTSCPYKAIEALISLHVDRVLTSGLERTAKEGIPLLKELNQKYGDKIQLLAGGAINALNAREIVEETGIKQIHSSCRSQAIDTTTTNNGVSYGCLSDVAYDKTNENKVRELINSVKF